MCNQINDATLLGLNAGAAQPMGTYVSIPPGASFFQMTPNVNVAAGGVPTIFSYGWQPVQPMEMLPGRDYIHLVAICPHCHQKLAVDSNLTGTQVTTEALPEEE